MSKKIVIELSPEAAEALVRATGTGAIVDQIVPQLQGKVKRSVIEWHEWSEKVPEEITEYHPILARWRDPIMKAWRYDLSTKYDLYGCQEWAILPKRVEK